MVLSRQRTDGAVIPEIQEYAQNVNYFKPNALKNVNVDFNANAKLNDTTHGPRTVVFIRKTDVHLLTVLFKAFLLN